MIHGNTKRYTEFDVKVVEKSDDRIRKRIPVIIFCLRSAIHHLKGYKQNGSSLTLRYSNEHLPFPGHANLSEKSGWHDGVALHRGCSVYNVNGTITQTSESDFRRMFLVTDQINKSDYLNVFFVSFDDYINRKEKFHVTEMPHATLKGKGLHYLNYREIAVKRLAAPYKTNCTYANFVSNMFSHRYTSSSCKETCHFKFLKWKCNNFYPIWMKYAVTDAERLNTSNVQCLHKTILPLTANVMLLARKLSTKRYQ